MFVRVVPVKSKDRTKYVELFVERFWTRVRFPPPPPEHPVKTRDCASIAGFFFGPRQAKKTPHEAGQTSLRDVARTETTFATPERISRDTHRPNQTGPNTVALCQLSTDPSRVLRRLHRDAAGRHPWTPLSEEQLVRAVFRTLQIAAVGIVLVAPAAHRRFLFLILI